MNVSPMNSGTIVHERDQVLMGSRFPEESWASTFSKTRGSMYGPFFALRPMVLDSVLLWLACASARACPVYLSFN
jgi:hypothetical protein